MATRTVVRKERRLRDIPPALAGLLSFLVPGLGQIIIGYWELGLFYAGSALSLVGLIIWRISVIAYKQETWAERIPVAFSRQGILWVLAIALAALWVLIVVDAVRSAARKRPRNQLGYVIILAMFFLLGWQIVDIDLVKLVTEFGDAVPIISRIAWPWPAAVFREEVAFQGIEIIYSDCDPGDVPPATPQVSGEPYIDVAPRCGELSDYGVAGTLLTVHGSGFRPNEEVVIWWEDPIGKEFRVRYQGDFVTAVTDENGAFAQEFAMPNLLIPPSAGEGPHAHILKARQTSFVGGLKPSKELLLAIEKMVETIFLGMMATLFGVALAIPVSFLAARNLMSASPVTLAIYYATRFILNIVRSIEPIIWAIIATLWVGLGPFAGVIALLFHTIAALGKLYSEAIESIDPGPIEAINAVGANWIQTVVYAVIPQIIPPFVSFTIYRWDINIRMSTIIGAVGGGGIGFLLIQWIRLTDYRAAGIAVWFIAITVAILDLVSSKIRERYV
ncbi:MAG: phosphonate ABC transporter, permease protein PhnE [Anaerolineae bacterium]|nr:phosphonate ABC transporter, permease protein PhnE [Anaerolineae bacterium]